MSAMSDADCTEFLKWALPRLDMRWAGFLKVRRQVCKRLKRRIGALGLDGFEAYRERLASDPQEWRVLDDCCHITISRFFRDRSVFEVLQTRVLPGIARREARCWSAGCASGEEPYTVRMLWDLGVAGAFPDAVLSIVATDVDETMLARARGGCYGASSLRELPPALIVDGFDRVGDRFCVRPRHREGVSFLYQDLRSAAPAGPFDLILCRNVAFTYFAVTLQREVLTRLVERLAPQGCLVIGEGERLPPDKTPRLDPLDDAQQIFQLRNSANRR
jgi:chemotaxis protein methyltransferase CheR